MTLSSSSSAKRFEGVDYRRFLLYSLIAVTFIPIFASLLNFQITDGRIYSLVLFLSALTFLNDTHQWITLTYYANPRWRAWFNTKPLVFYVAPLAILIGCTALVVQPYTPLGIAAILGGFTANFWHHTKQNWGILTIIARARNVNIGALRPLMVNSWYFFLPMLYLVYPGPQEDLGSMPPVFHAIGDISVAIYVTLLIGWLWRTKLWAQDPLLSMFLIPCTFYFVPLVFLAGKPYAFSVFGLSHAAQYFFLVMISMTCQERMNTPTGGTFKKIIFGLFLIGPITIIAYTVASHFKMYPSWDNLFVRFCTGFAMSIALAHFWLDAFIWKMSSKDVRECHGESFAF